MATAVQEQLTYGLSKIAYSKITRAADGTVTYATPVMMAGAKEMSMPPTGEPVKVYADNVLFFKVNVNQGYDGTVTLLKIPEQFMIDCLGYIKNSDGVLIENADAVLAEFALLGEFDTDIAGTTKRWVLYNCTGGRTDHAGTTKEETLEPNTFALPITASPDLITHNVKASVLGSETDTVWKNWFTSVYTGTTEPLAKSVSLPKEI